MSLGGPTQTTVQSQPEYALPYVSDLFRMAQQNAYTPYTPFAYNRVAETSPLFQQGAQMVGQQAAAPGILGTMNVGGQQVGTLQAYMNPYQQAVTDVAKQAAVREYGQGLNALRGQAASRGAFGGSRQAILESELTRNLGTQLGNIQMQGSAAAFDKAGQLYGADVARQQQAAQQAMATGLAEQAQRQAQLDALYGEYERQRTYPQQQAEAYRNIIFGQQMPVTSSQYQAPANPLSQIVGIGSLLYGGMK
jgi:hypothetical protein